MSNVSPLMRPSLKVAFICTIAIACGVSGYIFGYFQGYLGGLGHPAMVNAWQTVNALNAIRENRTQDAIQSLEMNLDTEIIMRANYESSSLQLAKLFENSDGEVLVKQVGTYRTKYPSLFPDPNVQARIKEGLHLANE